MARCIVIKLPKTKVKLKILQSKKVDFLFSGDDNLSETRFSSPTLEGTMKRNLLKGLKEKNGKPQILCLAKVSLTNDYERKAFLIKKE